MLYPGLIRMPKPEPKKLTDCQICILVQETVCLCYNLSLYELCSTNRQRNIVLPRQQAMFFIKHNTKLSLSEIGEKFSGKDHATVLHAIKTIRNLFDTDKHFKAEHQKLANEVIETLKFETNKLNAPTEVKQPELIEI